MGRGGAALSGGPFGRRLMCPIIRSMIGTVQFVRRWHHKMEVAPTEAVELLLHGKLNAAKTGKSFSRRVLPRLHTVHEFGKDRSEIVAEFVDVVGQSIGAVGRWEQERLDARWIGSSEFDTSRPRLPDQHEASQIAVRFLVGERLLELRGRPVGNDAIRALRGPPMGFAFEKVGLPWHGHELSDVARLKIVGQAIGLRIGKWRARNRSHFNSRKEGSASASTERGAGKNPGLMRWIGSNGVMARAGAELILRPGLEPPVLKSRDRQPRRRIARCRVTFVSG